MAKKPQIWVFADLRSERLFGLSLKVLAKARELAAEVSGCTGAALFGSSSGETPHGCLPLEPSAERCVAHGADVVLALDHPALGVPRADLCSSALARLVADKKPMLVLFALSDFGRELAARVSALCSSGLMADCADLRMEGGRVVADCPAWGGQIMAEICFSDGRDTGLATVQTSGLRAIETRGDPGSLEQIEMSDLGVPSGIELVSSAPEPAGQRKLEEAEIVVAGGAGMGSADGFGLVRELAAAMGGEVGATRPPVLQNWVEEDRLIGQTGKSIRPGLLLTVGTSGAIQYTAGITDSGTIVAINRDPDASIFEVADLGVVADAGTLLPVLSEKVRSAAMRRLAEMLSVEGKSAEAMDDSTDGPQAQPGGFGAKMKGMREAHGWTREALAQSTGKSPEFIEQVENDEITPSVSFLLRLARAFKIDPSTFLTDGERTAMRDQRAQQYSKRTQNYSYTTLTPGGLSEHLRVFMVEIEPRQAHKPVAYKHEGEEFIYVMSGKLELTVGAKVVHLNAGESKHFDSEIAHKLKSLSDEPTKCLVALYTP